MCVGKCASIWNAQETPLPFLKWDIEVSDHTYRGQEDRGENAKEEYDHRTLRSPESIGQSNFSRKNSPSIPLSPAVSIIICPFLSSGNLSMLPPEGDRKSVV